MTGELRKLLVEMKQTKEKLGEGKYAEYIGAWKEFSGVARQEDALSQKQKALIGLAIGLSKQCVQCIAYHAEAAFSFGATPDEVLEAAFVAVLMDGGPALSHLGLVMKAIEEFSEPE
jgi:AhpD family alkylhydroperoxidase